MVSPEEAIILSKEGSIGIITINVPQKLNALNQDLYFRIATLMRDLAADPEVYITILTGKGRYFSAGADVTTPRVAPSGDSTSVTRRTYLQNFVSNNLELSHAFYTHPNILITALNGPAIGLSAAMIAFSDFIYAAPHTFLLTPFTSLGLVAEGGASRSFVQRLGISKANEALIMSKRITCEELVATGFVNKVFEVEKGDSDRFLRLVLEEVKERLGSHLNKESLVAVKKLIRRPDMLANDAANMAEVLGGLEQFVAGVPQEEFRKIASGEKKHKL